MSGVAVAALFEGILENIQKGGQLADVDISWNSLASADANFAAEAIAAVFRESVTLYHCDLSYCSMNAECCSVIGEGLRDNHSLYGLHMVGNAATMDADGFLTPLDANGSSLPQDVGPETGVGSPRCMLAGNPLNGAHGLIGARPSGLSKEDELRGRDVLEHQSTCWACEGWERLELEWPVDTECEMPKAVWVYTSLDSFQKGLRMKLDPDGGGLGPRFVAARMVPPQHRLLILFQVDSAIRSRSDLEFQVLLNSSAEVRLRASKEIPVLTPPDDQEVICTEVCPDTGHVTPVIRVHGACVVDRRRNRTNRCASMGRTGWRGVVTDGPAGKDPVLMPRITETEFKAKVLVAREKPFWTGFKRESPETHRQALKLDWLRCRLGHMVGDDQVGSIQEIVVPWYGRLIAIYRRYSALDVSGETELGITQLQASEMISSSGLIDGNALKVSDVDRFFIAAKVTPPEMKKSMVVVNDKSMVRYEFLEFILRIAHQLFKGGASESFEDALRLTINALDVEGAKRAEEMDAFFRALYTEVVDDAFKKHSSVLDNLYKRHSGSKSLPGKPKSMVLSEFQNLLDIIDAYDNDFQSRHSGMCFRMGMMTQLDECGSSRFQEMSYIEFLHAMGAIVFLRSGFKPHLMHTLLDAFFTERLPLAEARSSKARNSLIAA
eukprot:TRINITY_DN96062_c0_g1_i1.p1 TRINITY_DN96062_c0_g1~~TRINITY_DN96062_c0_g1_i1.p1  ORF type:complete len:690 (+),score=125.12 TRINITY_DN96062_c0_g1_i1:77-2071(+)